MRMFAAILDNTNKYVIRSNIFKTSIRFAGGGGRPGGKPVFNWKQKTELRLDEIKNKKVEEIKSFGDFDDIKDFINTDNGDQIFDLTDLQNFEEPIRTVSTTVEINKLIDISALYGSHKSYGFIKKEFKENVNKSFTRVRMSRGRPQ